jgi:hypothetical protein
VVHARAGNGAQGLHDLLGAADVGDEAFLGVGIVLVDGAAVIAQVTANPFLEVVSRISL